MYLPLQVEELNEMWLIDGNQTFPFHRTTNWRVQIRLSKRAARTNNAAAENTRCHHQPWFFLPQFLFGHRSHCFQWILWFRSQNYVLFSAFFISSFKPLRPSPNATIPTQTHNSQHFNTGGVIEHAGTWKWAWLKLECKWMHQILQMLSVHWWGGEEKGKEWIVGVGKQFFSCWGEGGQGRCWVSNGSWEEKSGS